MFTKSQDTISRDVLRKLYEYRQWRDDVLYRDEYECRCCQNKANLVSHHIKDLEVIIEEYHITNVEEALMCKELWSINNGLTMCRSCHLTFHNLIGSKYHNE